MIKPLVRIECSECSMFFKVPDVPAGLCAMKNSWTPSDGGCMGSEDLRKTPDKVHVVRCKDCKFGKEKFGNIECDVDRNVPPEYHGYDWFCPNGERREKC